MRKMMLGVVLILGLLANLNAADSAPAVLYDVNVFRCAASPTDAMWQQFVKKLPQTGLLAGQCKVVKTRLEHDKYFFEGTTQYGLVGVRYIISVPADIAKPITAGDTIVFLGAITSDTVKGGRFLIVELDATQIQMIKPGKDSPKVKSIKDKIAALEKKLEKITEQQNSPGKSGKSKQEALAKKAQPLKNEIASLNDDIAILQIKELVNLE